MTARSTIMKLSFKSLKRNEFLIIKTNEIFPANFILIYFISNSNSFLSIISVYLHIHYADYQDIEKDNKSGVPMRVFTNNAMPNYAIDMKCTTSIQSGHLHSIQSRLNEKQICPNEIIDLTAVQIASKLNAQSCSYEHSKLNPNMMSVFDVNNANVVSNFVELSQGSSAMNNANNLDILKGISKGKRDEQMIVCFWDCSLI